MKKLSFWLTAGVAVLALGFASCGGDDEDPTPTVVTADSCATAVYPTNTGDASIKVLNFENLDNVIMVEAGSELALAVEVTRGTERAKKIKLYQSTCENLLGNEVDLSDQPKGNANGIDLRRTDKPQVRDVIYNVPASGFSDIYLTIEVEEGSDLFTYTQLKLMVSGSGIVDSFTGLLLGGNNSALGSRLNTATGVVFEECDFADNIESVDITYSVSMDSPFNSYLCSNPARFVAPINRSKTVTTSTTCDEDAPGAVSVRGGNATYFATTTTDFDSATNADLEALTVSTTDNEYIQVTAVGQVFAFMTSEGQKGLVKVTAKDAGNTENFGFNDGRGDITLAVKVQR